MSRIKNWDKNYNAESASRRQMLWKQKMKELLAVEFEAAERLENAVKRIMGESGLPTWHNIPYLNFGRQVYSRCCRFSGLMLKNQIALLMQLAQQNQLKHRILVKIRNAIYEMFKQIK
jgi:hypothetical protein